MKTKRVYPACCTSAYCGRASCEGCPDKPILDEFTAWEKASGAVCVDPIWCPLVYEVPAKDRLAQEGAR